MVVPFVAVQDGLDTDLIVHPEVDIVAPVSSG
jgi:hypothetical protein